jgi:hypothetical protein
MAKKDTKTKEETDIYAKLIWWPQGAQPLYSTQYITETMVRLFVKSNGT